MKSETKSFMVGAWKAAAVSGWQGLILGVADVATVAVGVLVLSGVMVSSLGVQVPAGQWIASQSRNISLDLLSFIGAGLAAGLVIAALLTLVALAGWTRPGSERLFHALFFFVFLAAAGSVPVRYSFITAIYDPDRTQLTTLVALLVVLAGAVVVSALVYRWLGKANRRGPVWMRASAMAGAGAFFILGLRLLVLLPERGLLSVAAVIGGLTLAAGLTVAVGEAAATRLAGRKFARPLFVGVSLLAVGVCVSAFSSPRISIPRRGTSSGLPNIMMIVLDTVRADRLSTYGHQRPTTPYLTKIAGQGVTFTRAFSAAPWTMPSHATLFTGLYPAAHHCNYGKMWLEEDYLTLAETLSAQGYVTLGYSNNPLVGRMTKLDQGFSRFVEGWRLETAMFVATALAQRVAWSVWPDLFPADAGAAETSKVVQRWLEQLADSDAPFFIFINYMEAHPPMIWHRGAYGFFDSEDDARARLGRVGADFLTRNAGRAQLDAEMVDALFTLYDGQIRYLDGEIEKLDRTLVRLGLDRDTIFIVLSDHGELFGEHGLWGHERTLYNELLHVPLVVRSPGSLPAGTRVDEPVSLRELPAMIAALQKGAPLEKMMASLRAARPSPVGLVAEVDRPIAFMEVLKKTFPGIDVGPIDRSQKALIDWPWKLWWDSKGDDALYDLATDFGETANLRGRELQRFLELSERIEQYQRQNPEDASGPAPLPPADRETIEKLRSLGYLP